MLLDTGYATILFSCLYLECKFLDKVAKFGSSLTFIQLFDGEFAHKSRFVNERFNSSEFTPWLSLKLGYNLDCHLSRTKSPVDQDSFSRVIAGTGSATAGLSSLTIGVRYQVLLIRSDLKRRDFSSFT